MITVSIVSHGHGSMVDRLILQLRECKEVTQILLTRNIPEADESSVHPDVELISCTTPKGFGANHNRAFLDCRNPYFCVLNPDIQLINNPFPSLIACFETNSDVAVVSPLVLSPSGQTEDNIRRFSTPWSLLRKALGGDDGRYILDRGDAPFYPDWMAGMFMLFRADDFRALKGFDERFFLYYEDLDMCVRTWKSGRKVLACPAVQVIHDARRDSRKKIRYMVWHLKSMLRYFWYHCGRLPKRELL